eukprot:1036613-Rhodomonas_salina.1
MWYHTTKRGTTLLATSTKFGTTLLTTSTKCGTRTTARASKDCSRAARSRALLPYPPPLFAYALPPRLLYNPCCTPLRTLSRTPVVLRPCAQYCGRVACYALATPCPVLSYGMLRRARY